MTLFIASPLCKHGCGRPRAKHRSECTACRSRILRRKSQATPLVERRPGRGCAVPGCTDPHDAHGLCHKHDQVARRERRRREDETRMIGCWCGIAMADHPKCCGCQLLAGDGAHVIPVAALQPWGDEVDLCPSCRRARMLRGAA